MVLRKMKFLERLDPLELEKMQKDIAYSMIRRKSFNDARVLKKVAGYH